MDTNWSSDGLEVIKLRLVRAKKDVEVLEEEEQVLVQDFAPTFVYPIFGQEETIFGYNKLAIQLQFASGSLHHFFRMNYSAKFPSTSTVQADDPEAILYKFMVPNYSKSLDSFLSTVETDSESFKPLGTKIGAFRERGEGEVAQTNGHSSKGKGKGKAKIEPPVILPERNWEILTDKEDASEEEDVYEAYHSNWATPGFKEFHRRMQIFVLLFIEGASYVDEEDPRWEFVTLFEKRKTAAGFTYHFMGYVSFYTFFHWPDTKRLRLAQFLILPPFQGQGHGSALYNLCFDWVRSREDVSEMTVEDPSEVFDVMRDKSDLFTLIESDAFKEISAPFSKIETEKIRKRFKIADRQFYRVLEMYLLLTLPESDERAAKAFRLVVKKRLNAHNKDLLSQLEPAERIEKLQETFQAVESEYFGIIEKFRP